MPAETAWQRRVRRVLVLTGTATTAYLFFGYLFGRMRDARVRALKERREKEVIKAHFTSVLSTISFTLYALLPTLEPQLFAAYPVEATSQALQAKTGAAGNSVGSPTDTGTTDPTPGSTPADSLLLLDSSVPLATATIEDIDSSIISNVSHVTAATSLSVPTIAESVTDSDAGNTSASESSGEAEGANPAESWASEFGRASERTDDDVLTASTMSQAISLPPTDTSSVVPSPTSELSALQESPPRPTTLPPSSPQRVVDPRSKKVLWRDLKVQSLTRALSTAYLVPLVYLLTSSQLTILARMRYLADVKASNAQRDRERVERERSRGLFGYFSVEAMGLGEYVERGAAAGASLIPASVSEWFFGSDPYTSSSGYESPDVIATREAELELQNSEAERLFLTYSWWLLHEGWRTISGRVEHAVDRVFGPLGLKREVTPELWDALVKEVRACVETEVDEDESLPHGHSSHAKAKLYDFTPLVIPVAPLPPTFDDCPLPLSPDEHGAYLVRLLSETKEHLASPDARLLIDKGVSAMLASLGDALAIEPGTTGRRFADTLPQLNTWSKGVWEGIPDSGVETLLALPEFEAFAALVFGDWAPR